MNGTSLTIVVTSVWASNRPEVPTMEAARTLIASAGPGVRSERLVGIVLNSLGTLAECVAEQQQHVHAG